MRPSFLALLLCAALPPAAVFAQATAPAAPPALGTPINGTLQAVEGSRLTIAGTDGSTLTLQLAPDTRITAQQKAAFSDIQAHDFIASAGLLGPDGKTHAQEVRIFPESMRGQGEGHRPMALPNQTMTNATVSMVGPPASMTNATVASVAGGVLTTVYPGGSTEIVVDPATPVWKVVPGDRSRLLPGARVRAFYVKADDGSLNARYIALQ
jgi:hypothetical protein